MNGSGYWLTDMIVAALVFLLVVALWLVGLMLWTSRRASREERIRSRLGLGSSPTPEARVLRLWQDGHEVTTTFERVTRVFSWQERLARACRQAGLRSPPAVILGTLGGVVLAVFVLALIVTQSLLAAGIMVVATLLASNVYLNHRISRQRALFERQFLDALSIAVRSLRAGHPLVGAFRFIAEEIGSPVGDLFADICQQQSLGVSLDAALRQVAEESDTPDLQLFASLVLLHLRSGGALADMMDRLAAVIRDRVRLSQRVRVLTAQTQFSKRVLLLLPFIFFVVISLRNPDYLRPLFDEPVGKLLLAAGGVSLMLGAWVMNRMAAVRY